MTSMKRALAALAAVVLITGAVPIFAQEAGGARTQPPPPQQQQQPPDAAAVARGQLVKVDSTAKMIVIQADAGGTMQFNYTDDTRVTGADRDIAGLATMTGTLVTVHFTKTEHANVATQIEVQPKKS